MASVIQIYLMSNQLVKTHLGNLPTEQMIVATSLLLC